MTFDVNGGNTSIPQVQKEYGTFITLPTPTRTGYRFDAWYDKDGTKIGYAGTSYKVTSNITLYAQWNLEDYLITKQNLVDIGWKQVTDERVNDLRNMQQKYGITTLERVRHFFGQCGTESGYGWLREGEYMLKSNGGNRTQQEYEDYYNTNYSYGYKYRGCGYIQTTFADWYYSFATYMIAQTYPELNLVWKSPANTGTESIKNYYNIAVSTAQNAGKNIKEYTDIVDLGCDYTVVHYAAEISGFRWAAGKCNDIVDNCVLNGITGNSAVELVTKNVAGYTVGEKILNAKIEWYNKTCAVIK